MPDTSCFAHDPLGCWNVSVGLAQLGLASRDSQARDVGPICMKYS